MCDGLLLLGSPIAKAGIVIPETRDAKGGLGANTSSGSRGGGRQHRIAGIKARKCPIGKGIPPQHIAARTVSTPSGERSLFFSVLIFIYSWRLVVRRFVTLFPALPTAEEGHPLAPLGHVRPNLGCCDSVTAIHSKGTRAPNMICIVCLRAFKNFPLRPQPGGPPESSCPSMSFTPLAETAAIRKEISPSEDAPCSKLIQSLSISLDRASHILGIA